MHVHSVTEPYLQLSGKTGYSRHGDTLTLSAERIENNSSASITSGSLALQLWACPSTYLGGPLQGHKIAEFALGTLSADHFMAAVECAVPAVLPHGGDFAMVMTLAEWDGEGFNRIHDFQNYPERDLFLHPKLGGSAAYRFNDDGHLVLEVGRIENPRSAESVSGNLRLELWALSHPYGGADFAGHPLAGISLGSLQGGASWRDCHYELEVTPPSPGTYHLALMLREWTHGAFVTREYTNFEHTVTFPRAVAKTTTPEDAASAKAAPAEKPAVTAQAPETAPASTRPVAPGKDTTKKLALPKTSAASKSTGAKAKAGEPVNLNEASEDELRRINGLTPDVARRIANKRPFASFDELLAVKGIGQRLLEKLRSHIRL